MPRTDIPAPHGRYEALWEPHPAAVGAVLVCHPSPQLGGTMDDRITYRMAKTWFAAGFSVLRFNYSGVGLSDGQISDGSGEVELADAEIALAWLKQQAGALALWVSGYSYGSRVALQLSQAHPELRGVLAFGYAADLFDNAFLARQQTKCVFLHGDRDEFGSLARVRELMPTMPAAHRLVELEGTDHFANGRLESLVKAMADGIDWLRA